MKFSNWKQNLSAAMPALQRVALGRHAVSVVALSDRVALGLPPDKRLATEVVNLFRPMNGRARLVSRAVGFLAGAGLGSTIGKKFVGGSSCTISWLQEAKAVGFLGCNPSHGLRCILLSRDTSENLLVTKLAIGGDIEVVSKEAEKLIRFSGDFDGIPTLISSEKGDDWAAFSMNHLRERGPLTLDEDAVMGLLQGWLIEEVVSPDSMAWLKPMLAHIEPKLARAISGERVHKSLFHGDFTPWNLRLNQGDLFAIDWEWSSSEGLGGLDLGHGLFMTGRLVDDLSGGALVDKILTCSSQGGVSQYLMACGWKSLPAWLAISIIYSSTQTGLDVKEELIALQRLL